MDFAGVKQPRKIAIVGSGIAGLSAAHRLLELAREKSQPIELTLYEAGDRVGGVFLTRRIDDYLVELGPDMFITDKPAALDLVRRLDLEDQLISTENRFRKSLVLSNGKPVEIPEGFMLMAPARVWPVLKSPIFSLAGKMRMGWERFVPRKNDFETDESLASFVRRRFGNEAFERLIQPLVGGIYTADPEKLSLKATLPRFLEMEQQHGSLIKGGNRQYAQRQQTAGEGSGARYGMFVSFRDGIQTLVARLTERVESHAKIRLNQNVTRLSRHDSSWMIETSGGKSATYDAVLIASSARVASELLQSCDESLSERLGQIEYASSVVVSSGHSLTDIIHPLDAFGLVIPERENRDVIAISFTSRKFVGRAPNGKVLLRTFLGGALHPEVLHLTDDEIRERVARELREILGVQGNPDFAEVMRYENKMPQYHVGHLDLVEQIEQRASQLAGLELAGNSYRGVGIPDVIISGESAAERLMREH